MYNLSLQLLKNGIKYLSRFPKYELCSRGTIRTKSHLPEIKTAVLMIYTGGPKCFNEIRCFLKRLMEDKSLAYGMINKEQRLNAAEAFLPEVEMKYEEIGSKSPQLEWTRQQGKKLESQLDLLCHNTNPHKTFVAYQFVRPSIYDALERITALKCLENIVILPMYPQYSCGLTGGCYNTIYKYFKSRNVPDVKWFIIDSWSTSNSLVQGYAFHINEVLQKHEQNRNAILIFAGHPMPNEATDVGDFYPYLVGTTMVHIMKLLKFRYAYTIAWHDGPSGYKWYQPLVSDVIRDYYQNENKDQFVVVPITTVTENMITKVEYDICICKHLASELGVNIVRVPAPNTTELFIQGMTEIIKDAFEHPGRLPRRITERCPVCVNSECLKYKSWFREIVEKDKPVFVSDCQREVGN